MDLIRNQLIKLYVISYAMKITILVSFGLKSLRKNIMDTIPLKLSQKISSSFSLVPGHFYRASFQYKSLTFPHVCFRRSHPLQHIQVSGDFRELWAEISCAVCPECCLAVQISTVDQWDEFQGKIPVNRSWSGRINSSMIAFLRFPFNDFFPPKHAGIY